MGCDPSVSGKPLCVAVPGDRAMEPSQGLELSPVTVCKKHASAVCGCSCTGAFPRTLMQPELGGSWWQRVPPTAMLGNVGIASFSCILFLK